MLIVRCGWRGALSGTLATLAATACQPDRSDVLAPSAATATDAGAPGADSGAGTAVTPAAAVAPPGPGDATAAASSAPGTATSPADDPCAHRDPARLQLRQGRPAETPWGLTIQYTDGGHKILMGEDGGRSGDLPFYSFVLRHQGKRLDERREADNWREPRNWRGFCWRGVGEAAWHPRRVEVEVAPRCDAEGRQVSRGCAGAFSGK